MARRNNVRTQPDMTRTAKFKPPDEKRRYPSRCAVCGGTIIEKVVAIAYPQPDGLTQLIKGVPAGVCRSCHEQYLRPEVSRRIEEILSEPPTQQIEVPMWDWPEVHRRAGFTIIRGLPE